MPDPALCNEVPRCETPKWLARRKEETIPRTWTKHVISPKFVSCSSEHLDVKFSWKILWESAIQRVRKWDKVYGDCSRGTWQSHTGHSALATSTDRLHGSCGSGAPHHMCRGDAIEVCSRRGSGKKQSWLCGSGESKGERQSSLSKARR